MRSGSNFGFPGPKCCGEFEYGFDSVGLGSYGPGLVFRVLAGNSRLRVARTNPSSDSDSTQNIGSYRVFGGDI